MLGNTQIYMKTQYLQTNQETALFKKRKALVAWKGKDRIALIKSLIYTRF